MVNKMKEDPVIREKLSSALILLNKIHHTKYELGEFLNKGGFTYVYDLKGVSDIQGGFVIKYTPRTEHNYNNWDEISALKENELSMLNSIDARYCSKVYYKYTCKDTEGEVIGYLAVEHKLQTLEEYLKSKNMSIPVSDNFVILKMMKQLAQGLVYIHNTMDISHRDIKPDNIVYDQMTDRFIYIDFNISEKTNSGFDGESRLHAVSPLYSSPEYVDSMRSGYQFDLESEYSKEMDIYSLGACFYYLLTGQRTVATDGSGDNSVVYTEVSMDEKQKVLAETEALRIAQKVVLQMVEENPDYRYRTAQDVLMDIQCLFNLVEHDRAMQKKANSVSKRLSTKDGTYKVLEEEREELVKKYNQLGKQYRELKKRYVDTEQKKEALSKEINKAEHDKESLTEKIQAVEKDNKLKDKQIEKKDDVIRSQKKSLNNQYDQKQIRFSEQPLNLLMLVFLFVGLYCIPCLAGFELPFINKSLPYSDFIRRLFDSFELQMVVWITTCISGAGCLFGLLSRYSRTTFMRTVVIGVLTGLMVVYPVKFGSYGLVEKWEFKHALTVVENEQRLYPKVTPKLCEHAKCKVKYDSKDYTIKDCVVKMKKKAKKKAFSIGSVRYTNYEGNWTESLVAVDNTANVKPQTVDVVNGKIVFTLKNRSPIFDKWVILFKLSIDGVRINNVQKMKVTIYDPNREYKYLKPEKVCDGKAVMVGREIFAFYSDEILHSYPTYEVTIKSKTLKGIRKAKLWTEIKEISA